MASSWTRRLIRTFWYRAFSPPARYSFSRENRPSVSRMMSSTSLRSASCFQRVVRLVKQGEGVDEAMAAEQKCVPVSGLDHGRNHTTRFSPWMKSSCALSAWMTVQGWRRLAGKRLSGQRWGRCLQRPLGRLGAGALTGLQQKISGLRALARLSSVDGPLASKVTLLLGRAPRSPSCQLQPCKQTTCDGDDRRRRPSSSAAQEESIRYGVVESTLTPLPSTTSDKTATLRWRGVVYEGSSFTEQTRKVCRCCDMRQGSTCALYQPSHCERILAPQAPEQCVQTGITRPPPPPRSLRTRRRPGPTIGGLVSTSRRCADVLCCSHVE